MIRTTALPVAALLGLTLVVPTGAHAVGETCQGRPATVVGTDGQPLLGTEGIDVIVTNGASRVDALGGDDLVCVTGTVTGSPTTARTVEISAGHGNDSVEVSSERWSTRTELGDGTDTFVSTNGESHLVDAGTPGADTEADVVRVGPGSAEVTTGQPGATNADVIDLSAGGVTWQGIQAGPGSVSTGGAGFLRLTSSATEQVLNAQKGTMVSADTALAFTGVTTFAVTTTAPAGHLSFRGSHRPERLTLRADRDYGRYVAMGGADDVYESDSLGSGGRNDEVRGNGGRDHLLLNLPKDEVEVDTSRARVVGVGPGGGKRVASTRGFEDLTLGARYADVAGARGGEHITVVACRATVSARKGADVVSFTDEIDAAWDRPRCGSWRAVADGGRGNDTLLGGSGNDRLVGGPGRDRVEGRGGRDTCEGERRRTCELRR